MYSHRPGDTWSLHRWEGGRLLPEPSEGAWPPFWTWPSRTVSGWISVVFVTADPKTHNPGVCVNSLRIPASPGHPFTDQRSGLELESLAPSCTGGVHCSRSLTAPSTLGTR
jgi:hypothetical protein